VFINEDYRKINLACTMPHRALVGKGLAPPAIVENRIAVFFLFSYLLSILFYLLSARICAHTMRPAPYYQGT
jgi:hypothetical protein